jgi:hypothetical protein
MGGHEIVERHAVQVATHADVGTISNQEFQDDVLVLAS